MHVTHADLLQYSAPVLIMQAWFLKDLPEKQPVRVLTFWVSRPKQLWTHQQCKYLAISMKDNPLILSFKAEATWELSA